MKSKKAQVSVEFLLLTGFIMLIFIATLAVFSNRMHNITVDNKQKLVDNLAEIVIEETKLADQAPAGYTRTFNLPSELAGEPYTLKIEDNMMLIINYSEKSYVYPISKKLTRIFDIEQDGSDNKYEVRIQIVDLNNSEYYNVFFVLEDGTGFYNTDPGECNESYTALITLSGYSNAHAEVAEGPNGFSYDLCYLSGNEYCPMDCTVTDGTGNCPAEYTKILALYDRDRESGSHVESYEKTDYKDFICCKSCGTLQCTLRNQNSCNPGETCVVSLNKETNSHIGSCIGPDKFEYKLCCKNIM
ncbi:hypothetical protein JXB31_05120 [Candidatus Woesearchaeota archaeon]|nr:hypothetical protein [Candidatus Woesearchaeota archaeon]